MLLERQGPPEANRGAEVVETAAAGDSPMLLHLTDILTDLDALAAHVDGAFVVVLKVTGTQYRRRCYLTAKAAEDAARRATERGESATVYLAELRPLWRLRGDS